MEKEEIRHRAQGLRGLRMSGWQLFHGPVGPLFHTTVGWMGGGYRINKAHMGKGRGGRTKWGWSEDPKHCEIKGEGIVWRSNSRPVSLWLEVSDGFRTFRLQFLVSVRRQLNLLMSSGTERKFPSFITVKLSPLLNSSPFRRVHLPSNLSRQEPVFTTRIQSEPSSLPHLLSLSCCS